MSLAGVSRQAGMPTGRFRIKWLSTLEKRTCLFPRIRMVVGSQFWGPGIYVVVGINPHVKFMRLKVTGIILGHFISVTQ